MQPTFVGIALECRALSGITPVRPKPGLPPSPAGRQDIAVRLMRIVVLGMLAVDPIMPAVPERAAVAQHALYFVFSHAQ